MILNFMKYQGAGNDFIICDMRTVEQEFREVEISRLCDRRFGVGADGFMTLTQSTDSDFTMRYWNSDGKESTMCGNGGRCIVHYAHSLGIGSSSVHSSNTEEFPSVTFTAIDGKHNAFLLPNDMVKLEMVNPSDIEVLDNAYIINTGSPHYIQVSNSIDLIDINTFAPPLREMYNCNINFVEVLNSNTLRIRTFERGVEAETFACGTGATAAAIVAHYEGIIIGSSVKLHTLGGVLQVDFSFDKDNYNSVFLTGAATSIFSGTINI